MSGEPCSSQHCLSFAGSWEEVLPGEKLAESSGRSLLRHRAEGTRAEQTCLFAFLCVQDGPLQEGSEVLKRVYASVWFLMS